MSSEVVVQIATRMASDLAEYAKPGNRAGKAAAEVLAPTDKLLVEYHRRVQDPDLRSATRSRFVSTHYADAVEAGAKALNECVRSRTGRSEDGDSLMTVAFSPKAPLLRVNPLRTKGDESEQRGHMYLCQGVVAAWRNPRAHSLIDDDPARALMMLETIDSLMGTTKTAVRTRRRKPA